MPKGYWVAAYHEIHDADKFAAYLKLAGPAIAAGGGTFLTRGMAAKAYESGILQRTTIIEFESLDAALAVHDGPDYAKALEALDGAVTRDLRFIEGVE
ncbi:MAG: DUF1330 domain-containing protein [Alphaproteobacteria bacterium]|jgi:uncharacterized protein (DUF1330 family)|nr:DUF1330 domain-containing protein [Alphaproteobacteria bacterium]